MDYPMSQALQNFTDRYVAYWQLHTGRAPASAALFGVPSPCIVEETEHLVHWLPAPQPGESRLDGVERALSIELQPAVHDWYGLQYAGDLYASFEGRPLELVQVWSEADFIRIQENLIGHLLMQKRLKLSPTLFIGTTDSETTIISLCNLSGRILLEEIGTRKIQVLAAEVGDFTAGLEPRIPDDVVDYLS